METESTRLEKRNAIENLAFSADEVKAWKKQFPNNAYVHAILRGIWTASKLIYIPFAYINFLVNAIVLL